MSAFKVWRALRGGYWVYQEIIGWKKVTFRRWYVMRCNRGRLNAPVFESYEG